MSDKLMPHGSLSTNGLVAKVASPIKINIAEPFGSALDPIQFAKVAASVPPKTPTVSRLRRLNAGRR